MREMKVRAWNKIDKVMITDLNSVAIRHGVIKADPDDILMWFTGLKDKNGVEVFEGDVISWWNGQITSDKNGNLTYASQPGMRYKKADNSIRQVVFDKSAFRVKDGNPIGFSQYLKSEEIEVVGNIYENKDLI